MSLDFGEMINKICERVDSLEKENQYLKEQMKKILETNEHKNGKNTPQKMIDFLEEQPPPSISFNNWIEHTLSLVQHNLDVVFKNDLLTGINTVLTDSINNYTYLPIAVFDRKPNTFYYYNDDEKWTILDLLDLNKFIGRIAYRFLVDFNLHWYQPNIKNIKGSEEYQSMYNSYYLNILGGHRLTDESRNQRVKNAIYMLLKQPINK
jgi:hypothetical protein